MSIHHSEKTTMNFFFIANEIIHDKLNITITFNLSRFTNSKKAANNILNQWKNIERDLSQMSKMTRDFLAISATDVECERVFNTTKALYDHRKTYNSIIFFAYMMMRFHDQKKNLQTKLNVNLSIEKKMSHEDFDKKMKKRINELQHVYNERYISDDEDEDDSSSKTNASRLIKIRRYNLIPH